MKPTCSAELIVTPPILRPGFERDDGLVVCLFDVDKVKKCG